VKTSKLLLNLGISLVTSAVLAEAGQAQQQVDVRVNRWLELQQMVGKVLIGNNSGSRSAKISDRLQNKGDTLTTQDRSTAKFALDTGIGTLDVTAKTQVIIQDLILNQADQSRVTRLNVPYGRVKLKLRKFTNPNSRLEIETPAGISGVRGTEFGMVIQPSGKTSLAVLEGAINTNAQGVDVGVNQGFQNFTIPGEPPSEPVPLRDDPSLQFSLERRIEGQIRQLQFVGQVDPVNSVSVNGQPQNTDRQGRFSVNLRAVSFPKIQVMVTTPLGQEKLYDLAF
jgi:hypothetical protein